MPDEGAAAPSPLCACVRYPATGANPDRLAESGEVAREARLVHQEPQCTEHIVSCTACGTRYWVVEDNGHWSGPNFTWTTHPPLI